MKRLKCGIGMGFLVLMFVASGASLYAQYTPEQILKVEPSQSNVLADVPKADEVPNCKIIEFKEDSQEGVCLTRPDGVTPLRVWCAAAGAKNVEQVRFYRNGIEIFRDVLGKEVRWLGDAGSRRGEVNDKGEIVRWLSISPEEVTAEVTAALASGDVRRYKLVALSATELDSLGLKDPLASELRRQIDSIEKGFGEFAQKVKIPADIQWGAFNGNHPALIPQGKNGLKRDLPLYYNAGVVLMNRQDPTKNYQFYIGDMVKIGDAWKIVGLPAGEPYGSTTGEVSITSTFFPAQGDPSAGAAAGTDFNALAQQINEAQKLLEKATPEEFPVQCEKTYKLLIKLAAANPKEEVGSVTQAADLLFSAIQSGMYPQGTQQLAKLCDMYKTGSNTELAAHIRLRLIDGTYYAKTQTNPRPKLSELEKAQSKHAEELAAFVEEYPQTHAGATAMMYLALNQEYIQEDERALNYYSQVAKHFGKETIGKKAAGAAARLQSVGKEFTLPKWTLAEGGELDLAAYRGKSLVIFCWASWNATDVERLAGIVAKNANLAVVGVNLDNTAEEFAGYVKGLKTPLAWKNVFMPGGLESEPAVTLGIPNVPLLMLLDAEGKVVRPNIMSLDELEVRLKD